MTPQELKNSILKLAFSGKLVEQRPEEGSGEELYQQIQSKKQVLMETGKVKRDSRLHISVPNDDFPFEIPKSWKWTYLGNILNKLTDGTHRTPKYVSKGINFISVKDISNGKLSLEDTKYITLSEHKELIKRCNPVRGDILLSKVGTTGVPAIVDTDKPFSLFVSVALLKWNHEYIDTTFLCYLLRSPLVQTQASENTRGVGNKNWVLDAIAKTKLPLPPLEEQKRIVAKIEELMPLVDRYKKAWDKLQNLDKEFPVNMQKSILQMAFEGRLVPQNDSEEQVGPSETISNLFGPANVNGPFNIPDSWRWSTLGGCCEMYTGNSISESEKKAKYQGREEGYDYIGTKDVSFNHDINYNNGIKIPFDNNFKIAHGNSVLMCIEGGSASKKIAILDHDVCFGNKLCMFKANAVINTYLYYWLQSMEFKKAFMVNMTGIIGGVSIKKLKSLPIPLPPLEEQRRIVAKIEELMPLVDRYKKA